MCVCVCVLVCVCVCVCMCVCVCVLKAIEVEMQAEWKLKKLFEVDALAADEPPKVRACARHHVVSPSCKGPRAISNCTLVAALRGGWPVHL